MKQSLLVVFLSLILILVIQSCKEKEEVVADIDKEFFKELSVPGFVYFENGNMLSGVSPSPHGNFKLRFNAIAAAALDSSGRISVGNSFPNGSVIVKEIYLGADLNLFAVMKKEPGNENAESGWLWAEYKPDGSVAYNLNKKGAACVYCHGGPPNRDFTRTFDLH